MKFTSERVLEDFRFSSRENYLIYLFHSATYKFCVPFVTGNKVLDVGCGSGYGAKFLMDRCAHFTGVDISKEAVEYARSRYSAPNVNYELIQNLENNPLPFADEEFDIVLSFQVIEHIRNTRLYLSEIRRVLKQQGLAIFATPDRRYRLFPFQKPWNRFHVREYTPELLQDILAETFSKVDMYFMGGDLKLLGSEFRRTNLMKWLTLPITLPFVPEIIRVRLLEILSSLKTSKVSKLPGKLDVDVEEEEIRINTLDSRNVNLISIASGYAPLQ